MATPFDIQNTPGLTESSAAQRLRDEGYNELPSSQQRTVLAIALEVVREPMFLMLVACGGLYMLMGELSDALMLLGFVFVVMGITIVQERRTERALEALKDLSSPRALVIRDGQQKRIAGRDVVRGDIDALGRRGPCPGRRDPSSRDQSLGGRIVADRRIRPGAEISCRRGCGHGTTRRRRFAVSLLRHPGHGRPRTCRGPADRNAHGTRQDRQGDSDARAGTDSPPEGDRQARSLPGRRWPDPLRHRRGRLRPESRELRRSMAGRLSGRHYHGDGHLAGGTAGDPDDLPGLGRMADFAESGADPPHAGDRDAGRGNGSLRRQDGNIDPESDVGAAVVCDGESLRRRPRTTDDLPETFHRTLEFAILASKRDPFDPMEKAIRLLGDKYLARSEHLHDNWTLVHEYPLSPELLALSHVWQSPDGSDYVVAAKGAPEAIADLCHFDAHGERRNCRSRWRRWPAAGCEFLPWPKAA